MAWGEIPERLCTWPRSVAPSCTTATRARPSRIKKSCDELVVASVKTAALGTNRPWLLPGSRMRAVANIPGLRARSVLGNSATTTKVRELGSTDGLMAVTLPWKVRPGYPGTLASTGTDSLICGELDSGTCSSRRIGVMRNIVAIFEVTPTYWPAAMGRELM